MKYSASRRRGRLQRRDNVSGLCRLGFGRGRGAVLGGDGLRGLCALAAALVLQAGLCACSGDIAAPALGEPGGVGSGAAADPAAESTTNSPAGEKSGTHLRRLTPTQYKKAVMDLVGIEPEVARFPEVPRLSGLVAIGAATVAFSARDLEALEAEADRIAGLVVEDAGRRADVIGCDEPTDSCLGDFVRRFGRRVFRRPLETNEEERLLGLHADAVALTSDPWMGARYVLSAFLQSPQFLYRAEIGTRQEAQGTRPLTGYELATRLSFLLWDSVPDEALLDAAERGDLDTAAGLETEARRLLSAPQARTAIETLFEEYLGLSALDDLSKDPEVYPQMSPTLAESMRQETLRLSIGLLLDEEQAFQTLFTSRRTYLNPELSTLYGVTAPSDSAFSAFEFPEEAARAGVLTHASLLATNAHQTESSPTLRGKFIRESLLCQAVPPPPPNVNTQLPEADASETTRERLARHREDRACAGCHALLDPPGIALEQFDGIGAYRETEHDQPIDPSGELDGSPFDDAVGLGQVLADHPKLAPCFARVVLRYARGTLEQASDSDHVQELVDDFEDSGFRLAELLIAVVKNQAFRTAPALSPEPPP